MRQRQHPELASPLTVVARHVEFLDDWGVSIPVNLSAETVLKLSAETVDEIIAGGAYFAVIRDDGERTTVRCREERCMGDDEGDLRPYAESDLRATLGIAIDRWTEEQNLGALDRLRDCLKEMVHYIDEAAH